MKRYLHIAIFLMLFTKALAQQGELSSILRDGGFSPSEQKVISAIFDDAIEKGLFPEDLLAILKENRLKKNSYFETVEALVSHVKIQMAVKENQFPYWSDINIRRIGFYLAQFYTFNQFGQITAELKAKEIKKQDIENIFQFVLFLNSSGIIPDDSFSLVYLLLKNKEIELEGLNAIKRLILRSKDLKLSQKQIVMDICRGLIKGIPLRKIVFDLEKKVQME